MDEFFKSVQSTSWWLGVVFVGIALNILSAYLKSPLDRVLSRYWQKYALRTTKAHAKQLAEVERFRASADLRLSGLTALVAYMGATGLLVLMCLLLISCTALLERLSPTSLWIVVTPVLTAMPILVLSLVVGNRAINLANTLLSAHSAIWRESEDKPA